MIAAPEYDDDGGDDDDDDENEEDIEDDDRDALQPKMRGKISKIEENQGNNKMGEILKKKPAKKYTETASRLSHTHEIPLDNEALFLRSVKNGRAISFDGKIACENMIAFVRPSRSISAQGIGLPGSESQDEHLPRKEGDDWQMNEVDADRVKPAKQAE